MTKLGENPESSWRVRAAARFGPFAIDAARRQLARGTVPIHLTPKAFDLLLVLVREAPRVVSKGELHDRLWPDSFVTDASIAELVKEIRRALDNRDVGAPVIRTAHRIGYALCLDVDDSPARPAMARHWLSLEGRRVALQEGKTSSDGTLRPRSGSIRRPCPDIMRASPFPERIAQLKDLGSKNGTTIGHGR